MNNLFMLDIDTYIEIMEEAIKLGKERGKKEGENLEVEFFEVAEKLGKLNNIKHLGQTEMDSQLLKGNLEEEGLRILDLTKRKEIDE